MTFFEAETADSAYNSFVLAPLKEFPREQKDKWNREHVPDHAGYEKKDEGERSHLDILSGKKADTHRNCPTKLNQGNHGNKKGNKKCFRHKSEHDNEIKNKNKGKNTFFLENLYDLKYTEITLYRNTYTFWRVL